MAGTTDTVPAMLTPGEFVIKQESAAMLGEPLLRKLNAISDNAPQGYQVGGGVSQNIGAHGNIDALIGQAQLANMNPMYGGNIPMTPSSADFYDKGFILPETDMGGESVAPYEAGTEPGDPTTDWLSKGLLSPQNLDEPRMTAPDLLKIIQENNKATDKRKKNQMLASLLFALPLLEVYKDHKNSGKITTFQQGGGVGEAGRKYPPGTLMSPFMGDKAPIPEAWMQPATESMPSPEEVAEFDRMIEMLQAKELLKKQMQKMQELGMFSDKEAIEYKEGDILPPWQGKRNFKGDLYEDNIELPVAREGYLQR